MRRTLYAALTLAGLAFPAPAAAQVWDTYSQLAERDLRPAPLVPTHVPPLLEPLDRTISSAPARRRGAYALRVATAGSDAIIVLSGGEFPSIAGALRDGRRFGFKPRSTRVRGRRGYLLRRPQQWMLLWAEGGRVYSIATGTPRKVSLRQLRDTADGLDRLESAYIGQAGDPDNPSEGFVVTTQRTATAYVTWGGQCSTGTARAGDTTVTLVARQGDTFGFDIASEGWTGRASGTIAASAITLDLHATGTFDGAACDTGPVRITLAKR